VDVLAEEATYEIQWGSVQRPTHENTSWDWARFETCAHKWVDLSEGNFGVSLLNDCKYGHDIHGSVIRLSLLRSPAEPDAHADEGFHAFTYSLLPHSGHWDERTVRAAYALNDPWQVLESTRAARTESLTLLRAEPANAVIETVKPAEDGRGWIVRLYESQRCRGRVALHTGFDLSGAAVCDLLENDQQPLPVAGRSVAFDLAPFQIVTLRLLPEKLGKNSVK
jgi:alpha-mannosidase